jgi:hypothetical protein
MPNAIEIAVQEDADRVMERYSNFCDTRVHRCLVEYRNLFPDFVLTLGTFNWTDYSEPKRVIVEIRLASVAEFRLYQKKRTANSSVSDGIQLKANPAGMVVEFGGRLRNFESIEELRYFDYYAIGKKLEVEEMEIIGNLIVHKRPDSQDSQKR